MVAEEEDVVRDQRKDRSVGKALTRRAAVTMGLTLAVGGMSATGSIRRASATARHQGTPEASTAGDRAEAIVALTRDVMAKNDLKAVIVRVTIDGQEVVTTR